MDGGAGADRAGRVFLSYSHTDAALADRLVEDLRESRVLATYDKWQLRVGDSIIGMLAKEITDADTVVVLLSPASVESSWVNKELALAMTGELATGRVKVLPAVVADCSIPPSLRDKLYADFRFGYYRGLRALLEALRPDLYALSPQRLSQEGRDPRIELEDILAKCDRQEALGWLHTNAFVLASALGSHRGFTEAIPEVPLENDACDFVVVQNTSLGYWICLVALGAVSWPGRARRLVATRQLEQLSSHVNWCRQNQEDFRRTLVLRMQGSYGARDIAPSDGLSTPLTITGALLVGRRSEYTRADNRWRSRIAESHGLEIASYDRLLPAASVQMAW
jgi:hypothetical protein